jgi:hypothetical protein
MWESTNHTVPCARTRRNICYPVLVVRNGALMHWYHYVSYFFGGAFLANSLPHLVNGVSGRSFQSPFAKPPGKGLSSPAVNVVWGFTNLLIAYMLLHEFGAFSIHNIAHVLTAGVGAFVMSVNLALTFGRFHSGR